MTIEHKTAPAFQIVKDFEAAIGEYTGAPSVVCVNSCTMALKLSLEWMANGSNTPTKSQRSSGNSAARGVSSNF